MNAPDWYAEWRHGAVHELMEKNDRVIAEFRISNWPRWDYDLDAATLTFSEDGIARVVADVCLIGSTSNELKNWQWGWANKHWPHEVIAGVEAVKAFGEEHRIDELTEGWVDDEEDLNHRGWELSAVAARILEGRGVYRPQTDNGAIFFLYRGLRFVS